MNSWVVTEIGKVISALPDASGNYLFGGEVIL